MKKTISFALFDTGETIFSALIFSTFFPLYITQYIDTKIYSFSYGVSFILSFFIAILLGKIADEKGKRKNFFIIFSVLVSTFSLIMFFTWEKPFLSLFLFIMIAIFHQQAFVFYNSLLLNFDKKGLTSGIGVSFGYIGSALALIFFAGKLNIPDVYIFSSLIFLLFSIPSFFSLENPTVRKKVHLLEVFKDTPFITTIVSILFLTEVANTLIAMMGIYLKNVYSLQDTDIYRIIGFSAIGGVFGGFFWGYISDKVDINKVFPLGFALWLCFLLILPFICKDLLLYAGFLAGFSLSHLWTTSRLIILKNFPEGEASVRLSFLSLTERIASSTGLLLWSFFLFVTDDNYKLSVLMMSVLPLAGIFVYFYKRKLKS